MGAKTRPSRTFFRPVSHEFNMRGVKMNATDSLSLLSLPPGCVLEVLRHLDARSLVMLELTGSRYFSAREQGRRLSLVEEVAKEVVLQRLCGSMEAAERFRHRSWRERLHLEEDTGAGFDRTFSSDGGFEFQFAPGGAALQSVRLTGMGPKLLISDISTQHQAVLHWQLRVRGNTAVEFGVIPADLAPSHTALHKCMSAPDCPQHRAQGFCSQITAGSLLPLKVPVMRGTLLDIVARRGHLEVLLRYPEDAKEITWQNGQPTQRPYRGPSQLRLEQDFPPTYHVRLALTSWARAHFEVLHGGYALDPEWAAAASEEHAAATAAEVEAAAAAAVQQQAQHALVPLLADELLAPIVIEEEEEAAAVGIAVVAGGAGALPGAAAAAAFAAADPLFPLLGDEEVAAMPALAAGQPAHPLAPAHLQAVAGAVLDAAVLAADDVEPLALAGGMALPAGLFPEPEALAAVAAVVGADPQPAHLAALHQLHAHAQQQQQQQWPAAGPALQQPQSSASGTSAAAAGHPATARLQQHLPGQAAQGAAMDEEGHGALAPLCPSPSVELSLDGQLPSPE